MALFRPLVLCYHAVSDTWNDRLATRVADFEEQLQTLVGRGFRGATAADLLNRPSGRRLLHVTFDDAFQSVENAVPILERLEVPATIFVCSELAASGRPLQVPELEGLTSLEERVTLTWDWFRSLGKDGLVGVGSHTGSHPHLTRLSDEELRHELQGSKAAIEDELQRPCELLAYPYGEHDERVRAAVREAGYSAAFAAPGKSWQLDRFQVPRTAFWRNETPARWAAKTRFPIRVARELGITPKRRSPR